MEAQILASLTETLRALVWQNTLLGWLLVGLTVITLVGFAYVGVHLRESQGSLERIAEMTAEVLRRTPPPDERRHDVPPRS